MRFESIHRLKRGFGLLLLPLASCATVDHRPELTAADDAMSRASGMKTTWAARPDTRELVVDDNGRVPLESVIELTLSNNRSLRADLEVLGQAKADLVQAVLLSNPVLSLMSQFPEGGGRADVVFGLSRDIADLWLRPVRKRAAQAMVQQRVLSFADTAIALLNETRTAYFGLQYQVMASELQDQNLKILQESMEVAQARLRAGDTTQLDVNLVRARYLEAQNQLLQLHTDAGMSRRTLLRLMGVSRASAEWNPETLVMDQRDTGLSMDESELVEGALLQRLDVQAANWELEAAIAEYDQQRRRVIPSLNLGLAGERFERRPEPGRSVAADTARASIASGRLTAPGIQSRAQRRQERSREIDMVLGPSIEMPLPIFDQNQAQIAKAQFRAKELQQRYEEIEQRVAEGVRNAFVQRRLAEDRVKLFRDSLVPLQEANLSLAQTAYQSGRESILTVLLAQESLIRTRLDHAAAVRDLEVSTANIERQLAGPVPKLLPPP
ncbi:MAG: TolC family protein [Planctomycetes bacterium]|nr:TolC family protein [Planctomycetota bacterium]MBI3833407.1 TolC family protein [Planctomycetota bacterium]